MGLYDLKLCSCGSGLHSTWTTDAKGYPLTRTCAKCHDGKMKGYRKEVLINPECEEY